ncbi:MAG TPA: hypothetical protein DIS62_06515 [Candidatus Kerfeldbacteria bacterium]|nr:MAG: hypothetical protein UY34_C0013G0005 [Parcubacteria group bacterium GW2011_GWA2_48_9]HCJ52916.1 hypothetical protein [Candidatus Kerfeldbacteria bacterium]HCM68614.1 hypothetical protein [Candidatus Kerfeldbacteria bacterium]
MARMMQVTNRRKVTPDRKAPVPQACVSKALGQFLPEYLTHSLTEPVRTRVEQHLKKCASCRKEAEEFRSPST